MCLPASGRLRTRRAFCYSENNKTIPERYGVTVFNPILLGHDKLVTR